MYNAVNTFNNIYPKSRAQGATAPFASATPVVRTQPTPFPTSQAPAAGGDSWDQFLASGRNRGEDGNTVYDRLAKHGEVKQPDFLGSMSAYGPGGEVTDLQPQEAPPMMKQPEESARAKIYALLQKYYGDPALSSVTNVGISN